MSAAYYANQPLPDTNARQATVTVRPSSTALLTIDSEDRYTSYVQARANPTSPYNFSINKSESLMPGFMTRIGVTEINFPFCVPNINQRTSIIGLVYKIGAAAAVTTAFAVSVGFYRPAQLATYIQTFIQENTPLTAFTMDYGLPAVGPPPPPTTFAQNEPVFRYATNTADTVSFFPLPYNSPAVPPLPAYPYPSTTKQLFDVLGFTAINTALDTNGVGSYTLCQSIRYIDIVCNQLTNSQAQKDQTSQTVARDMLCRIYLGDGGGTGQSTIQPSEAAFCPPGCAPLTLYRNFATAKQIQWIPNQNIPGFLQFQVYDDAGEFLDTALYSTTTGFPFQYIDWSMTLQISEC